MQPHQPQEEFHLLIILGNLDQRFHSQKFLLILVPVLHLKVMLEALEPLFPLYVFYNLLTYCPKS